MIILIFILLINLSQADVLSHADYGGCTVLAVMENEEGLNVFSFLLNFSLEEIMKLTTIRGVEVERNSLNSQAAVLLVITKINKMILKAMTLSDIVKCELGSLVG